MSDSLGREGSALEEIAGCERTTVWGGIVHG